MENLKLVVVGHVDHGKSTLIGRLFYDTGSLPEGKIEEIRKACEKHGTDIEFCYVMDHLSEERDQGITIDTAQKFFKTGKRSYTIIDAPGHVEFIKNMITGASHAEAAILVVDASEGVREQTRRHAHILGMLGLTQVIVAVNKMDKIGYSMRKFNAVKNDLLEFLEKTGIKPSYVIPVSAKDGDNIVGKSRKLTWFSGPAILAALDTFTIPEESKNTPLRYPVQDVYLTNDRRIVAGRIASGTIKPGDRIIVLPSGETTKVEGIVEWESDKENEFGRGRYANPDKAEAGKSTGLILSDKISVDRGHIVSEVENKPTITDSFKAHVFWMDEKPYRKGERISFKCATQEVMCEIEEIEKVIDSSTLEAVKNDADEIRNTEVADIRIKTSKPVCLENFNDVSELGRFVFERKDTCAGGIITAVN